MARRRETGEKKTDRSSCTVSIDRPFRRTAPDEIPLDGKRVRPGRWSLRGPFWTIRFCRVDRSTVYGQVSRPYFVHRPHLRVSFFLEPPLISLAVGLYSFNLPTLGISMRPNFLRVFHCPSESLKRPQEVVIGHVKNLWFTASVESAVSVR